VRRLIRAARAGTGQVSGPLPVRIAGIEIRDLVPASSSGATVTKVGRLSLRGHAAGDGRVKVVEAHSAPHARLIACLSDGDLADVLPRVLGVEGRLVVTSWIERAPRAQGPDAAALAGLLARIHATAVPALDPGFDVWADHVLPRARRAAEALGSTARLESLLGPARELASGTSPHVQHADLTPDNVVPRAGGGLAAVDNELLGVGSTPWLDLANLARGLDAGHAQVLTAYREAGGVEIGAEALHGARAMWLARMVGAWFIAGRLSDAWSLLDAGADELRLPFER
jgi:aminoglycoside phosphotransferase (APT) family kinase protein